VDLVGLDVYDTASVTYPGAAAEFQNMVTQPLGPDWIASFAASHRKELYFPEVELGHYVVHEEG
jgi:hypothetical protein